MSGIDIPSKIDSEDNIKRIVDAATYQPSHIQSLTRSINGWDSETIYYAKKIGDLAGAYNWIHNNTAFWYSIIDYILHFSVLVLKTPSFAGILATIDEKADTVYVKIVLAFLIAVGFIVKGMHIYLNFSGKISNRRSSATRYSTIFAKVRNELIKNDEDRREASDFINEIEEEFTGCYSESPACWSIIVRRYLLMMKGKTDIKYSELFGIREIKIRRRKLKQHPREESSPRHKKPHLSPKSKIKIIKSKITPKKNTDDSSVKPSSHSSDDDENDVETGDITSSQDSEKEPNNSGTPGKNRLTSKMMSMFDMDLFRMGKAQKQYQMDRHFIDADLI